MIITRFAPSPTGLLHIGNLRTALIAYLFARKYSGRFLLRIDDTDLIRSTDEFKSALEEDLRVLGLNWDGEFQQSKRLGIYQEKLEFLKNNARVYECFETPAELETQRAIALKQRKAFIYNRASLELSDAEKEGLRRAGHPSYFRFKLDRAHSIEWLDLVKGSMKFNPCDLSDPIVVRSDGSFTYLLISVIDDIDMNITHIIRGEDHLSNTATQVQMFEALSSDAGAVQFAHLPLVNMSGGKISKRVGGMEVRNFLSAGILPISLLNYLSHLGSGHDISKLQMELEDLWNELNLGNFSRSSPTFDLATLENVNTKALRGLDIDKINKALQTMGAIEITLELWELIKNNVKNFEDISIYRSSIEGDFKIDQLAINKSVLELASIALPKLTWGEGIWQSLTNAIKSKADLETKTIFTTLRMVLTGGTHGPEMSRLILLLGQDNVSHRINEALRSDRSS